MTISAIRLHPYDLPLVRPWVWAGGVLTRRQGVIVRVETWDGRWGVGDCAPLPVSFGGESAQAAQTALTHAMAMLPGQGVGQALAGLDLHQCPAARCALETALLDVQAQCQGVSLSTLLDGGAADRVLVNASLGCLDDDCADRAAQAWQAGYTVAKLKIGLQSWDQELPRLLDLIGHCAGRLRLRLDANGAWDAVTALRVVKSLSGLDVEGLEDPLADPSPSWLRRLQDQADFPIAADDALIHLGESLTAGGSAVRRWVLKPSLLGGPLPCMALALRAKRLGIQVVVTSVVDSSIGVTAAAHVAAALDSGLAHGLATTDWLAADVAAPPCLAQGYLYLPSKAGLGVCFHPAE